MFLSLLDVPTEALEHVAAFLSAPDVLRYVTVHPCMYKLGQNAEFWLSLTNKQYSSSWLLTEEEDEQGLSRSNSTVPIHQGKLGGRKVDDSAPSQNKINGKSKSDADDMVKDSKVRYLTKAHIDFLPEVRWKSICPTSVPAPNSREGHLGCRLGNKVIVTGGFADDDNIYSKDIQQTNGFVSIQPQGSCSPLWVYGATLTALNATTAIRFGGFQAGGYAGETCQVAVLTINNDGTAAKWDSPLCYFSDGSKACHSDPNWAVLAARAYHSATILFGRYLLILGGMKATGCFLNPLLLDTETWTWYCDNVVSSEGMTPSARHGHSLIDDIDQRGRLLMFGGGSGSDLLRSGCDNCEVWALNVMGCTNSDQVLKTIPWKWNLVHEDQPVTEADYLDDDESLDDDNDANNINDDSSNNMQICANPNKLSLTEKLSLGRCHGSYRVSHSVVVLAFGSGRPSTNSVIAYNLQTDDFFRPKVTGPTPIARFSFASAALVDEGYILFHGGYSVQNASSVGDICVLDLAPQLNRPFRLLALSREGAGRPPADVVTRADVPHENTSLIDMEGSMLHHLMTVLRESEPENRAHVALFMFAHLQDTEQLDERCTTFLYLVATGRISFTAEGKVQMEGVNG